MLKQPSFLFQAVLTSPLNCKHLASSSASSATDTYKGNFVIVLLSPADPLIKLTSISHHARTMFW